MHRIALVLLIILVMLATSPTLPARAQDGAPLRIVASFSILADVVGRVAGDAASVETLIPIGQNPHTFAPSAQDVIALSDADAVFVVGLNFEEQLLDTVREAAGGTVYELWGCLPIRTIDAAFEDHAHAEDGAHAETAAPTAPADSLDALCAEHTAAVQAVFGLDTLVLPGAVTRADSGYFDALAEADPHVWTDPVNVALWALMIRDMLSAEDPASAAIYAANAQAYLQELAALHADLTATVAAIPEAHRVIVTNHLTLGYFAARYGLALAGVVIPGGSTTAEPSVQEVLALIETVKDLGVPAIFTETTVSDSLAQQVAQETGAAIVPLIEGSLSPGDGPAPTYLDYMRHNAAAIAAALG